MGRSLRRAKKTRPTVSIRLKRKPKSKSRLPEELRRASAADKAKIGFEDWDDQKTFAANYQQANLVPDANKGFGRKANLDPLQVGLRCEFAVAPFWQALDRSSETWPCGLLLQAKATEVSVLDEPPESSEGCPTNCILLHCSCQS